MAAESSYLPAVKNNFTLLDSGYENNIRKRIIVETLTFILRTSLNIKEKSDEPKIFNLCQSCAQKPAQRPD